MKKARTFLVQNPTPNEHSNYFKEDLGSEDILEIEKKILPKKNPNIFLKGGRKEGLELIKNIENLKEYKDLRNYPYLKGTSGLSAHHKFGTVSIRESYKKAKDAHGIDCHFINELYWRDFYTYIAFHFPYVFGHAFQKKYENLNWEYSKNLWQAWCEGKTGYPIVDAGMRELNTTGWMHNRTRMIVASFLTKDLRIDWKLGEKYFAKLLIDYDPSVNNSSWQWASSTGTDAQPYFRIFNPWLQQKKFDPECVYIKKWIPELCDLSPEEIHSLEDSRPLTLEDYPRPIVDHMKEKEKTLAMFESMK